jgi:protein-S-isoprenylcysteine O-methyltransferase Ste14
LHRRRRFLLSCALAALNAALVTIVRAATHRPHDGRAFAAFLALLTIWCVIEGTLVDERPAAGSNLGALATSTGLAIVATFIAAIAGEGATSVPSTAIGACVMSAGVLLRCAAIYTLGDRFVSELRADTPLVRSGVYRWLDHPSEVGLLSLTFGAAMLFRSVPAAGVWVALLLPLTIARVRRENEFLRSAQGSHITSSMTPTTTERTGPSAESNTWRAPLPSSSTSTRSSAPAPTESAAIR